MPKKVFGDETEIGVFVSHVRALSQTATAWGKGSVVS